jgi:hypothetical protein
LSRRGTGRRWSSALPVAAGRSMTCSFPLPTVNVTAQKRRQKCQRRLSPDHIRRFSIVSEAAIFAPNTYFTERSARKLSNATFRNHSSPNNPGITTYIVKCSADESTQRASSCSTSIRSSS